MKIDILTLFPSMFDGFLNESIIKRAIDNGYVEIKVHNFRDYSLDPHLMLFQHLKLTLVKLF